MQTLKADEKKKRSKKKSDVVYEIGKGGRRKRSICTALSSKAALIRSRRSCERNPSTGRHARPRRASRRGRTRGHEYACVRGEAHKRGVHASTCSTGSPLRDGAGCSRARRRETEAEWVRGCRGAQRDKGCLASRLQEAGWYNWESSEGVGGKRRRVRGKREARPNSFSKNQNFFSKVSISNRSVSPLI